MTTKYLVITDLLCRLTDQIFWQPRKAWANEQKPGVDLTIVPGRGKQTYHQGGKSTLGHKIVFGTEMVRTNLESLPAAGCWLHAKEIAAKGYFQGIMRPDTLLAHVAAHEYAHFVQVLLGRRYKASVHNAEFYQILGRMHSGGHVERFRQKLVAEAKSRGISLHFERDVRVRDFRNSDKFQITLKGVRYDAEVVEVKGDKVRLLLMKNGRKYPIRASKYLISQQIAA